MSGNTNKDPLCLDGLEPNAIAATVAKNNAKGKQPSELDVMKEERLKAKEARLGGGPSAAVKTVNVKAPPEPPPAAPITADPQVLLDKIGAYKERFPNLKTRNVKLSAKSSLEEMLDELHYIEVQLGSNRDNSMGTMVFVGGMVGIEAVSHRWNPLNLRLEGLGKVAKDNIDEFTPLLDELMIKYSAGLYMSPETRLVLAVGALVVTVHSANSGDSRLAEAMQRVHKPVQPPPGADKL